jgi:sigma-B regulation protein RsbU (phosphoserine phosphatase)
MALSRTLIRTYLLEQEAQPARALQAANRRILLDSQNDLFVTVFCGILDPSTGALDYANAGHNPPYLFSRQSGADVLWLRPTGGALGVLADWSWAQETVQLDPGDVLVLYTDGVTEAGDSQNNLLGANRLLQMLETLLEPVGQRDNSAARLVDGILDLVRDHSGGTHQADDVTLMVVARDPAIRP